MTHRFSGSRKTPCFASSLLHVSLLHVPLLATLVGSGLIGCSAADPAPVGAGKQNGTSGQPGPNDGMTPAPVLPDGVTTTTDGDGNVVYVDDMGNVLEAVPVTNPDGSTGMVLQNPTTGSTVGMVTPTPAPASPSSPVIVVDPDDDLIIVEPEAAPIMDGDLVEGVVCNSAEVSFEPVIPTVMLLLDRSSSMFEAPYGTYTNRWEALRAAVALLEPFAAEVQFMGATYTSFNDTSMCPAMQGLEIVAATDNFASILGLVPETTIANPRGPTNGGIKGETPTAEAVAEARGLLAAVEGDGPKYLVIITDGEPDTCVHFDPQCGQDQAISEVQAAFVDGIQSIAIGISEDVGEKFLNDLAHAGVGAEVEPPVSNNLHCIQTDMADRGLTEPADFYGEGWRTVARGVYGATGTTYAEVLSLQPSDATLGEQLSQVVAGVRTCSFEMADSVVRAQAGRGAVQLQLADGTTLDLVHGDANGWDLDATRDDLVVVQGTACAQVQDQSVVSGVKIEFPCEIRIPKAR